MSVSLTSHVSQLLYRASPACNFAQVIGELRDAYTYGYSAAPVLTWDCDDIALLDFNAARVVIGFSDNLPGAYAACFTVATGQSPVEYAARLESADQDQLCQAITSRLEGHFPCDAQASQIIDQALTADLIDRVVDAMFATDASAADVPSPAQSLPVQTKPALTNTVTDPGDMDRLLQRLSTELTARTPSLISRAIASVSARPRDAGSVDQSFSPAAMITTEGTAPAGPRVGGTASFGRGLFRVTSKGPAADGAGAPQQAAVRAPRRTSPTEMQAVRDALYAADTNSAPIGRIIAQSRHTLQILAALPGGIANAVVDLRRGETMRADSKLR